MQRVAVVVLAGLALACAATQQPAAARDVSRPVQSAPTSPLAIPNPYAPPAPAAPTTGDRAADAYSMGFAIGLGTALINKQREDELKRQQQRK